MIMCSTVTLVFFVNLKQRFDALYSSTFVYKTNNNLEANRWWIFKSRYKPRFGALKHGCLIYLCSSDQRQSSCKNVLQCDSWTLDCLLIISWCAETRLKTHTCTFSPTNSFLPNWVTQANVNTIFIVNTEITSNLTASPLRLEFLEYHGASQRAAVVQSLRAW